MPRLPDVSFVRFPPRWRTVLVPVAPLEATTLGMSMYTASKPVPILAQRAVHALALVSRGRLIPGARTRWEVPVDGEYWRDMWRQWTATVRPPITGIAVYERAQQSRSGLTLMLCAGRDSVLIRVRPEPLQFDLEQDVSDAADDHGPATFRVPRIVARGQAGPWHWIAHEAMATRPHLPATRVSDQLCAEVSTVVEAVVPRPAGTPAHWRGAHGDLTPWNLRRVGRQLWLIDWEDACWAPPGADAVYFTATRAALHGERPTWRAEQVEAVRYWADVVAARSAERAELRMRNRLLAALHVPAHRAAR